MPRLLAIGDIHGCSTALNALLRAIDLNEGDRLVTLGDYVDRGPDTRGVIDTLLGLEAEGRLIPLLGNHEEMMLGALRGAYPRQAWLLYGGVQTLESYGFVGDLSVIPDEHLALLDRCLDYYEAEDCFFTHANYVAGEPMAGQPVEALRWQNLNEHLPRPHYSGKRAIVGHSAQKSGEVLALDHLWCLDTYCHGGGWLTACDVATGDLWQASADGRLRVAAP